jgi:hypothetical protein
VWLWFELLYAIVVSFIEEESIEALDDDTKRASGSEG